MRTMICLLTHIRRHMPLPLLSSIRSEQTWELHIPSLLLTPIIPQVHRVDIIPERGADLRDIEIGNGVFDNVRIGVGYNFVGTYDRDLVGYNYWSQGPFVTMRAKFTERVLEMFNK